MLKNALSLMRSLRKIVLTDEDEIWIDYDNKFFKRVRLTCECDLEFPFPPDEPSVIGLLKYLQEGGYIVLSSDIEYLTLTYKAFYYESLRHDERLLFIRHSVLVPIFLSLATNALIYLIQVSGTPLISLLQQWLQS